MINKVQLLGRVGQDLELRKTDSGKSVCNISVATNRPGDKDGKPDWHRVVCWEKTAELAAEYLKKGDLVHIDGRIQYREWEKDDVKHTSTDIICERMTFVGGGKNSDPPSGSSEAPKKASQKKLAEEDIPF